MLDGGIEPHDVIDTKMPQQSELVLTWQSRSYITSVKQQDWSCMKQGQTGLACVTKLEG